MAEEDARPGLAIYRGEDHLGTVRTLPRRFTIGRGEHCAIDLDDGAVSRSALTGAFAENGTLSFTRVAGSFTQVMFNGVPADYGVASVGDRLQLGGHVLEVVTAVSAELEAKAFLPDFERAQARHGPLVRGGWLRKQDLLSLQPALTRRLAVIRLDIDATWRQVDRDEEVGSANTTLGKGPGRPKRVGEDQELSFLSRFLGEATKCYCAPKGCQSCDYTSTLRRVERTYIKDETTCRRHVEMGELKGPRYLLKSAIMMFDAPSALEIKLQTTQQGYRDASLPRGATMGYDLSHALPEAIRLSESSVRGALVSRVRAYGIPVEWRRYLIPRSNPLGRDRYANVFVFVDGGGRHRLVADG